MLCWGLHVEQPYWSLIESAIWQVTCYAGAELSAAQMRHRDDASSLMCHTMLRPCINVLCQVSDIAIAVREGADAVMLSGETAYGKFPFKSVDVMATVAKRTERAMLSYQVICTLAGVFVGFAHRKIPSNVDSVSAVTHIQSRLTAQLCAEVLIDRPAWQASCPTCEMFPPEVYGMSAAPESAERACSATTTAAGWLTLRLHSPLPTASPLSMDHVMSVEPLQTEAIALSDPVG